jgi:hypothetical protein
MYYGPFRTCMAKTSTKSFQGAVSYWLPIGRGQKYQYERFTPGSSSPALPLWASPDWAHCGSDYSALVWSCTTRVICLSCSSLPLHTSWTEHHDTAFTAFGMARLYGVVRTLTNTCHFITSQIHFNDYPYAWNKPRQLPHRSLSILPFTDLLLFHPMLKVTSRTVSTSLFPIWSIQFQTKPKSDLASNHQGMRDCRKNVAVEHRDERRSASWAEY